MRPRAARSADDGPWPPLAPLRRAFPSWFLRIECDRCGKVVMHNEAHAARCATGRCATSSPACVMTAAADLLRRRSC
jgi:hypothetical protein